MGAVKNLLIDFVSGYTDCALWASTDSFDAEGNVCECEFNTDIGDGCECVDTAFDEIEGELSDAARESMEADCMDFLEANWDDIGRAAITRTVQTLGHDFWLSRNGHGTGFWDRGLGDVGDRLHAAAKVYGESYLYTSSTTSEIEVC